MLVYTLFSLSFLFMLTGTICLTLSILNNIRNYKYSNTLIKEYEQLIIKWERSQTSKENYEQEKLRLQKLLIGDN